jgi:amino-acid N-acetyltransferase
MLDEILISRAEETDLLEVDTLLSDCELPTDGLAGHWRSLFLARSGKRLAGCAAVELYGSEGLLRSVAVKPEYRNRGLGDQLTHRVLQVAGARGVSRVYLLTETAERYFLRFGFVPVDRVNIPENVKESAEFTGACPESALAMFLELDTGEGNL